MNETHVHRVRFDVDRYQSFLYDLADPGLELWTFDGRPRADSWEPQPIYIGQPRLAIPDIWHLVGAAVLAMNEDVIDVLEPFVSSAGELLPLTLGSSQRYYALNILQDVDCLDERTLSLETLDLRPEFIEHRLPETGLFKIPILDTSHIFHVERDGDPDSFMQRYERNLLNGLRFERVWSSLSGPAAINLFISD